MSNNPPPRGPLVGPWIFLLCFGSGGAVGCSDQPRPSEPGSVTVQTIGDTTVVTSQRPVSLDTAHLVQVARIGKFDGPEEFLFSWIDAFSVGQRGEVYVAGEGIRVFSPDGSEVRLIARWGEGPGEVGPVTGLEVSESGRLLAIDARNRRVAVFDTSGAILDHWRLPYGRPGYGRAGIIPIPGDRTLLYLNPPLIPGEGPQSYPRPIYVRLDSAGAVLDTVFAPIRFTEGCPTLDDFHFSGGWWQDNRETLVPKVKWTASRTGEVVIGCPAEYQIDRIHPDGTVFRIVHQREPVIEPAEVIRSFVDYYEEWYEERGEAWKWEGPRPPRQKPYYHRVIVGRGGRFWVWPGHLRERKQTTESPIVTFWDDPRTGTFDVFDSDGHFLGPVLLPEGATYRWAPGYQDPFFAGDTIWLVRQDTFGVSYIDRMRIEW